MSSLEKLREITRELPAFPMPRCEEPMDFQENEMLEGTSLSWSLLNVPQIAVARWFNSNGSVFPSHGHSQHEWLIVYKGKMLLTMDGDVGEREATLGPGDFMYVPPETRHSATFPEDCWYVAITQPASADWPR